MKYVIIFVIVGLASFIAHADGIKHDSEEAAPSSDIFKFLFSRSISSEVLVEELGKLKAVTLHTTSREGHASQYSVDQTNDLSSHMYIFEKDRVEFYTQSVENLRKSMSGNDDIDNARMNLINEFEAIIQESNTLGLRLSGVSLAGESEDIEAFKEKMLHRGIEITDELRE